MSEDGIPSSDTPYDIALRFSRGAMSRDEVIQALVSWDYVPEEKPSPHLWEDAPNYVRGSVDDLHGAYLDELIDDGILEAIKNGLKERRASL